jgi:hypothetical protein
MHFDPSERPLSHLLPASKCLLQIRNATIHGQFTKAIRTAASIPDLFGYYKSKNKWSHQTLHSINWQWFQSAANNYTQYTDNHLMKLVHDKLPTTNTKVKTGGQHWINPICCICQSSPETFQHLLRCNHPLGHHFQTHLPRAVRTYCVNKNTPSNFQSAIVIAIEDWIRQIPPLEQTPCSDALKKLIHSQRQIGWDQFIRGHLSTQWQTYLEYELHHDNEHQPPESFNYHLFFSGLIKIIWTQQSQFWHDYQNHLHSSHERTNAVKAIRELHTEIRYLYSLRHKVQHHHKQIYFPDNLTDFLQNNTHTQLRHYITNYKAAIQSSIQHETQNRHSN